jgi:hypothetical protein
MVSKRRSGQKCCGAVMRALQRVEKNSKRVIVELHGPLKWQPAWSSLPA